MFMEVCRGERDEERLKLIFCSECSLDCGNGSRCLETKIPDMSEICACSDGTYTNSTCPEIEDINNITSINIHGCEERCVFFSEMIRFFFH